MVQEIKHERLQANDTLIEMLRKDVVVAFREAIAEPSNQLRKRTAVRTLFAAIEGIISAMKQTALTLLEPDLSRTEHAVLAEESYQLKDNGSLRISPQYIRLPANLRFSFEMYSRALGADYDLDVGDTQWRDFLKAIEIRNRLTHPKSPDDLEVSMSDIQCVSEPGKWFIEQVKELHKMAWDNLARRADELKGRLNSQSKKC